MGTLPYRLDVQLDCHFELRDRYDVVTWTSRPPVLPAYNVLRLNHIIIMTGCLTLPPIGKDVNKAIDGQTGTKNPVEPTVLTVGLE